MPGIPVLKPREVIAILTALGFVEARQRGSHKQFRHPDGRATTVPFHAGAISRQSCCARSPRTSA
jgi:predicted RNA binding protein YcfA (HicA-like mRNA interferase family)